MKGGIPQEEEGVTVVEDRHLHVEVVEEEVVSVGEGVLRPEAVEEEGSLLEVEEEEEVVVKEEAKEEMEVAEEVEE